MINLHFLFQVTGYLATLGGTKLEVLEEEKLEDGLYMATIGKRLEHGATIGKGTHGTKEEKEMLALSLLLNGCR